MFEFSAMLRRLKNRTTESFNEAIWIDKETSFKHQYFMICHRLIMFEMLIVVHHHSASSSNSINSTSMCLFLTCSMWAESPQRILYPRRLLIPRLVLLITPQTLHSCLESAAEVTGLSKLNILSTLSRRFDGSTISISRNQISMRCRLHRSVCF